MPSRPDRPLLQPRLLMIAVATLIGEWMDAQEIERWLIGLPQAANSGDIYAVAA